MDGQNAKCRKCGRMLVKREEIVEREIDDKIVWFCSEECAEKFEEENS
ncbi:YHS domain-containing protein [Candidatus Woesearchaeota archaeon]|nr:YHS domain-containing protein [Candidatus Woesearchaeota archaeon]MBT5272280.1 YHS domain-containing protein [Candidatus Woesearchaeota archaeon]MBT6041127.1 YHS domain-containing protein [Candidatus Woesearchaeota archaeon]MBT6336552.1 YHS domain-containing protein [Candidatus Woesearchaeota archaeon]MBT7927442.1 YHS domain-containing protein [Candidatus Woesearchaeota archaeon]